MTAKRHAIGECVRGRYDIRALLGEGATAEVYRALDTRTGRDVVLKVPRVAIVSDVALFNLYCREMEIAARLDHPGLQRLLSKPDVPFMVFEYIDGESLRMFCDVEGRCLSTTSSGLGASSLRHWNTCMERESSIAISSPKTS